MKQTVYLISLLLFSWTLQAQNLPSAQNSTDAKGLKQGKWILYYDADWNVITEKDKAEFYRTLTYKDSQPIGKVTDWSKYMTKTPL